MAAMLAFVLVGVAVSLPRTLGKAKASKSFRELFAKTRSINLMAAARIFMFGSRDVWFVVGLPVFLYSQGWHYMEVAGFIAAWTIGYGVVQALAPSVIRRSPDGLSREVPEARLWGAVLTAIPLVARAGAGEHPCRRLDLVVVTIGLRRLRLRLRRDLVAALLSDPRLCRLGEGGRGCRLLLRRQCRRPADGHPAVGRADASRRHGGVPLGFGGHAGAMPRDHLPAAVAATARQAPA